MLFCRDADSSSRLKEVSLMLMLRIQLKTSGLARFPPPRVLKCTRAHSSPTAFIHAATALPSVKRLFILLHESRFGRAAIDGAALGTKRPFPNVYATVASTEMLSFRAQSFMLLRQHYERALRRASRRPPHLFFMTISGLLISTGISIDSWPSLFARIATSLSTL